MEGKNDFGKNDVGSVAEWVSRQRGRMGKYVVFTTTLIEWSGFNPHPGHVVASLDKTLYDDYLCLVASKSSKFSGQEFKETHRNIGSSETPISRCGFLQSRSSRCNEKCADRPISLRLTLSGDKRINMRYNSATTTPLHRSLQFFLVVQYNRY